MRVFFDDGITVSAEVYDCFSNDPCQENGHSPNEWGMCDDCQTLCQEKPIADQPSFDVEFYDATGFPVHKDSMKLREALAWAYINEDSPIEYTAYIMGITSKK